MYEYDLAVYDGYAVFRQYYDTQGGQVSPANPTRPNPSHIQVVERKYWRQGMEIPGGPSTYTTNKVNWNVPLGEDIDQDDSYFFNNFLFFIFKSIEKVSPFVWYFFWFLKVICIKLLYKFRTVRS